MLFPLQIHEAKKKKTQMGVYFCTDSDHANENSLIDC